MADIDKRLRYYNGQFLQEQDFTVEQEYHLDRQRRHNRQLHTYGIAEGLTVTADMGATSATVSPGTAIDGEGRSIVLTEPRSAPFGSLRGSVLVVISYSEQTSDPATEGEVENTRFWERPDVRAIADDDDAPAPNDRIQLARLHIDAGGTIDEPQDTSVRTSAGVRLGTEVPIERIRLSRQGVAPSLWPVLSSGAPGQADVSGSLSAGGDLSVTGNVLVTGTVDGRDVAADGIKLDIHADRTDNPHNTTAAQLGAITGVGGVSNPGGQVALLAGNNISISPDSTNNRITIASSTLEGVSNPGGNIDLVGQAGITITGNNTTKTITFAGAAPRSIAGVSNPDGNIGMTGSGGITVTGDDAANSIRIGTSLADLGAFPSNAYLKRAFTTVAFSAADSNGASRTVNLSFPPKFVLSMGVVNTFMDDVWVPLVCTGYAIVDIAGAIVSSRRTISWIIRRIFGNVEPQVRGESTSGIVECELTDLRFFGQNHNLFRLDVGFEVVSGNNRIRVSLERRTNNSGFSSFTIHAQLAIFG